MLADVAIVYYLGKWSKQWKYSLVVIVILGSSSIVLVSISELSHVGLVPSLIPSLIALKLTYALQVLECLAQWAPPVFATLIGLSIAAAQTYRVWKSNSSLKHKWFLAISLTSREV